LGTETKLKQTVHLYCDGCWTAAVLIPLQRLLVLPRTMVILVEVTHIISTLQHLQLLMCVTYVPASSRGPREVCYPLRHFCKSATHFVTSMKYMT